MTNFSDADSGFDPKDNLSPNHRQHQTHVVCNMTSAWCCTLFFHQRNCISSLCSCFNIWFVKDNKRLSLFLWLATLDTKVRQHCLTKFIYWKTGIFACLRSTWIFLMCRWNPLYCQQLFCSSGSVFIYITAVCHNICKRAVVKKMLFCSIGWQLVLHVCYNLFFFTRLLALNPNFMIWGDLCFNWLVNLYKDMFRFKSC